jgi:hypothetical protein
VESGSRRGSRGGVAGAGTARYGVLTQTKSQAVAVHVEIPLHRAPDTEFWTQECVAVAECRRRRSWYSASLRVQRHIGEPLI